MLAGHFPYDGRVRVCMPQDWGSCDETIDSVSAAACKPRPIDSGEEKRRGQSQPDDEEHNVRAKNQRHPRILSRKCARRVYICESLQPIARDGPPSAATGGNRAGQVRTVVQQVR